MATVGIAELKAHLSDYVRAAQKGKEFIVKDRDTPVAKLIPVDPSSAGLPRPSLPVIRATRSMAEVERTLDAAPYQSLVPHDVISGDVISADVISADAAIDRAIRENKQDVSGKWNSGELT